MVTTCEDNFDSENKLLKSQAIAYVKFVRDIQLHIMFIDILVFFFTLEQH